MAVNNAALLDLIATTLADLPKQYFEVGWDHQAYEFCRIYQSERMVVDGGTQIDRKVMFDETGNARYRRLYDTDTPTVADVMTTITIPWTTIGTNYSWDVQEILRNKNSAKGFISMMKYRRLDGLWSLANLIEDRAWKTPQSATDTLNPYGVPYYLNIIQTGTTSGFVGGTINFEGGTSATICAGIDTATEEKWKNYAAVYTKIDNAMLKILRKAFLLTRFKPPLIVNDPSQKRSGTKRIYCDADNAVDLQDLADQRDDNHGPKDLAGRVLVDVAGTVFFNRIPVVYIPLLDNKTVTISGTAYTHRPIYCIDFEKFIPYVQDGYWMEETGPMNDRTQHTTYTVFLDGSHNNLCTNRREVGFVLHKEIV